MKKNILSIFSLCALMGLSGCNAFLELEPLDKVSPDQLLETEGGVKALLANIYTMIPMEDFNYRPNAGFNQRGYDGVNETTNLAFLTDEATRSDGGRSMGRSIARFIKWICLRTGSCNIYFLHPVIFI